MFSRLCCAFTTVLVFLLSACGVPGDEADRGDVAASAASAFDDSGIVTVRAEGLSLVAPAEIPSGWVTFRFENVSPMVHFGALARYPDGQGLDQHQALVAPTFQEGMHLLTAGRTDDAMAAFGALPEWFGDVVFMGGPGLTAAGRTSETTVYLEPGTYVMECYVKTIGIFHSFNPDPGVYGMAHQFTVTDQTSTLAEPSPTVEITLSSEGGLEVEGDVSAGDHTVAVHFRDQTVHENFVGHDVHLARLAPDADVSAVASWMDWRAVGGLETPAPVEFRSGIGEMPAGSTGYFTATLEPGRYAWISEVAGPESKNMLQVFEVN